MRDAWLREQGYRVLRFWDSQVLTAPDEGDEAIWQALQVDGPHEHPAPTPTLPREGGGGGSKAARWSPTALSAQQ